MTFQPSFTAPHYKAAQVGQKILQQGGTASEAMVAAAAMIAVQYPHMNSIGGDGFWLICKQGQDPVAIDACGRAAQQLDVDSYRAQSEVLPSSGGKAAVTMAGTISGWQKALELNGGENSLQQLLTPAIEAARSGVEVTQSLADASAKTLQRLRQLPEFARLYLKQGQSLTAGDMIYNEPLAKTLTRLAQVGLDDFYRGEIAKQAAKELAQSGSPITLKDFQLHQAVVTAPLTVTTSKGQLYNLGAPTQGLASLLILAIYDQLASKAETELQHIHLLVEATKQAFIIRDQVITDEDYLTQPLQEYLNKEVIAQCVNNISLHQAQPWPYEAKAGDTIWMGACDQYGTMVSFIQSIYWEFGSGVVLPSSGILWNIRSQSFSLKQGHHNELSAGKKPFHTLNPAYAELNNGTRLVYGTMGGEGQPQTQACLFSRHLYQNMPLSQAVSLPRWLLGRTWGDSSNNLRLEEDLYAIYAQPLTDMGHEVSQVDNLSELMGHAGAIAVDNDGNTVATSDPRSDGESYVGQSYVGQS